MPRRPRSITIISRLFILFGALLIGAMRGGDLKSHLVRPPLTNFANRCWRLHGLRPKLGALASRRLDRLPHHHQRPPFNAVPIDARRDLLCHSLLRFPPASVDILQWSLIANAEGVR